MVTTILDKEPLAKTYSLDDSLKDKAQQDAKELFSKLVPIIENRYDVKFDVLEKPWQDAFDNFYLVANCDPNNKSWCLCGGEFLMLMWGPTQEPTPAGYETYIPKVKFDYYITSEFQNMGELEKRLDKNLKLRQTDN
jgi:hypothetical protein